ncbi:MAG TPA: hypothetical protein DCM87_06530 [Planctomycetes bacterium]|nr:hypothetical protein [Planctomycetota bacterium]
MMHARLPRRRFLRSAAAAALAAGAVKAAGANDRLRIALIGAGGRGTSLMHDVHTFAKANNAEVCAICDVWRVNRERAAADAKKRFGGEIATSSRFGDCLALPDIDAVIIATPDFGHCPILKAAVEAGKDAYVEKPITYELAEARDACEAVRRTGRIVQVGTQRRSDGLHMAAAEIIRSGVLGAITRVSVGMHFNEGPRWLRPFADCKKEDVDWEGFLFNRPARPFDPKLLRCWHLYKELTNGIAGLWMSHFIDANVMLMDDPFPRSAVTAGGVFHWKDGRETSDTFHALLAYPKGFIFSYAMDLANGAGTHFRIHGYNGALDMEAGKLSGTGGAGAGAIKGETKIEPRGGTHHMKNFLECVSSRKKPNADIEAGWRHAVACVMTARALWTGRRQVFDPAAAEIREG